MKTSAVVVLNPGMLLRRAGRNEGSIASSILG
jgi:hypothetical protein